MSGCDTPDPCGGARPAPAAPGARPGSPAAPKTYDDFVREARAVIREVDAAAAAALLAGGALALDIREPSEVATGTVEGALAIPRGRLESDAPDWIFDPEAPLLVCCNTGKRSALAVRTLLEMGFTGAVSLAGGLAAWSDAGGALGAPRPM